MMRVRRVTPLLAVLCLAFPAGIGASAQSGAEKEAPIPFSETAIFFEFNATDQDVGIQAFFDAEGWSKVTITGPDGKLMKVQANGDLGREIGITELRFESEEPGLDEMPLEEFLDLFPAGTYRFEGKTVEGDRLEGTAVLTHVIPDAAVIVAPAEGEVVARNNAVIRWNGVPDPPESEIVGYEVIVESEDGVVRSLSAELPASARSLTVSSEFLVPGAPYKFEVIVVEAGGNKTISERTFMTAP